MAGTADRLQTTDRLCLGGVQSVTTNSLHNNDYSAPVGVCYELLSQTQSCTDSCSKVIATLQKTNGVVHGVREDGAGDALADGCNNLQTTETTDDAAVNGRETCCQAVNTAGDLKCKLQSKYNINGATDSDCCCCGDVSPSTTTEQVQLPRDVVGESTADNADTSDTIERWLDEVQDFANCNVAVDDGAENKRHTSQRKMAAVYEDNRPIRPAKCPDDVPRYEPTPRQVGKLRIVHISDTHGDHDKVPIPPGDILVHSGDFFFYTESNDFEADTKQIDEFFARQPHQHKIFVAGNHEMSFKGHSADEIRSRLPHVVCLQDSPVTIEGLVIYGSPWCGERGSPADAFTIPFELLRERAWNRIPMSTDLLVTHAAPHRILDNQGDTGCKHLREAIFSAGMKICMHMFGHAHESPKTTMVQGVLFSNGVQCCSRNSVPNVVDLFLPPSPKKHRKIHCNVS